MNQLEDKVVNQLVDRVPVSLGTCPIVDAVIEIRFESNVIPQAVFGIIYEKLRLRYPKAEQLPIAQIPGALLQQDQNLRFQAQYRLSNDKYLVQVGPEVLTISPIINNAILYPGWSNYSNEIKEVLELVLLSGIVKVVSRIGIRYTNFFPAEDILNQLRLSLAYNGKVIPFNETMLRTDLGEHEGFRNTLQVSNAASRFSAGSTVPELGSVIDVDTFRMGYEQSDVKSLTSLINTGHLVEKKVFWTLLKDELRERLQPNF